RSASGSVGLDQAGGRLTTDYSDLAAEFDYSSAEQLIILHNLSAQLSDRQTLRFAGRLTQVHSNQIGYSGTALGEDIAISSILGIWPEQQAAEMQTLITQNTAGGQFKTLTAEFEGMLMREQNILNFSRLNLSGEYANIRLSYKDDQYETVVGTLNGSVDLKVGTDGQVQSASTIMSVRDGFLRVAGYAPTIRVPSVDLVLRQQGTETVLQNLFVEFEQLGRFSLSGVRRKPEQVFVSEAKLEVDSLDAELFQHLWPKQLAPRSISWMRRHIVSGEFGKSRLSLSFTEEEGRPKLTSVIGDALFSEASFRLYENMTPATGLSGLIKFEDNQMMVNIQQGVIDQLSVTQAQVKFGPLLPGEQKRDLRVRLNASGNADTVLQILGHNRINQLQKLVFLMHLDN
ncbi:MAG: DUF3971 domain-containing protein, partial [Pseudomonadota bacterium]|nr:DUF3971 domain-containing protein [Pseudomonadota bacterium]